MALVVVVVMACAVAVDVAIAIAVAATVQSNKLEQHSDLNCAENTCVNDRNIYNVQQRCILCACFQFQSSVFFCFHLVYCWLKPYARNIFTINNQAKGKR